MEFSIVLTGAILPRRPIQPFDSGICDMESSVPPIAALTLPSEEDTLPVLSTKLSSFLYVLHMRHDLAAATRSTFHDKHGLTPEAQARNPMTHHEKEYFQAWKDGTLQRLPPIDWENDRGRSPTAERPMKRAQGRAAALNRIYQTDRAQPCHYIFFTQNHSVWLPLVAAISRIIGAEINQKELLARVPFHRTQIQTIDKIVQVSRRVISPLEASPEKAVALEKVRYLEEAKKNLQRKQQDMVTCLGKRKHGQDEVLDQEVVLRDLSISKMTTQDQCRADNNEDGTLPLRMKTT